jgi:hypothetical protein
MVLGIFTPPPPGECVVREGGSCESRVCVGAVRGGAACGRAGFDAINEKEMEPLESVQVKLTKDACGVKSRFRGEFGGGVGAEGENGGEVGNGGGVRDTCTAHDDGENADGGARPELSKSID